MRYTDNTVLSGGEGQLGKNIQQVSLGGGGHGNNKNSLRNIGLANLIVLISPKSGT